MSISPTPCPPPEALEQLAAGQPVSDELRTHVDACQRCGAELRRIEIDNRFLAEFLTAGGRRAELTDERSADFDVPGYDIQREIHRGGQGVVFQAVQRSTKRLVAIKVIRQGAFATGADRARFLREIETLGRLDHPNIVAVHDAGLSGGFHYFVMDYVDGLPLDEAIAAAPPDDPRRPRPAREHVAATLAVFVKICDAVHAAHLRGVVHRDLKPSNIRVDRSGEPYVLDFGLAKSVEQGGSAMTHTGQFVGSLPWAAPEQVEGAPDKIDLRSDVYSLGAILYRLLTGAPPFDVGSNLRDTLDDILQRDPRRPSTVAAAGGMRIDDEVETIILKCLSKDRERRYQSAGELARDLRRYLAGEAIDAKRDSAWYVIRKTAWKKRRVLLAAAVPALLLLVAAVALQRGAAAARQADQERSLRQVEAVRGAAIREIARRLHARPGSSDDSPGGLLNRLNAAAIYTDLDAGGLSVADYGVALLLAETFRDRGDVVEAENLVRRAIYMLGREHGPRHPEIGRMRTALADMLLRRGTRMVEAEQAAELAVRELSDAFGSASSDAARGWIMLARVRLARGSADSARDAALQALAADPRADSIERAETQLVLARIDAALGDSDAARDELLDGLRSTLRLAYDTDSRVLDALELAAELAERGVVQLADIGDFSGLRGALAGLSPPAALRETASVLRGGADGTLRDDSFLPARFVMVALRQRLLGDGHPSLGPSLAAAASSLFDQSVEDRNFSPDGVREAAALFQRAIPLQIAAQGPDSPLVGKSYEKLGGCCAQLSRLREAADWYARDCELWMRQPPEVRDEYQIMLRARWTAWYMTRALEYEKALVWCDRALDVIARRVGLDHPGAALAHACKALCLAEIGRPDQALASEAWVVKLLDSAPVPADQRVECLRFLGLMRLRLGRIEEARAAIEPAWETVNKSYPNSPSREFLHLEWNRTMYIFACGTGDELRAAEFARYIREHASGDIQPDASTQPAAPPD